MIPVLLSTGEPLLSSTGLSVVMGVPTTTDTLSLYYADEGPITTISEEAELTFVAYREFFFNAGSVNYTITGLTAVEDTDFDSSLDPFTGTLSFAANEIWKKVTIRILPGATAGRTIQFELSDPVNGRVVTSTSVGTLQAGNVRFYALAATGDGSGSSPANTRAWNNGSDMDSYLSRKTAGHTALLKRGDIYPFTAQIRITRGQGGTKANPMIVGAYGPGNNPTLNPTGDAMFAVTPWVTADEDTGIIFRDMHFEPVSNNGGRTSAVFRSVVSPFPDPSDEGYYGYIVERCSASNPNNYAGFKEFCQHNRNTSVGNFCKKATMRFCDMQGVSRNSWIPYDAETTAFTAPTPFTVTGGTSGATSQCIEVIDDGGGTGRLRISIDIGDSTGVWQDNEIVTGGGGSATTNIPSPTGSGYKNPHQVMAEGGSGCLVDVGHPGSPDYDHRFYGNTMIDCAPPGTTRGWAVYFSFNFNLNAFCNRAVGPQGFKFRGCITGAIHHNYSLADGGAQNFNINYTDSHDFSDVEFYSNVLEGVAGYVFEEADGTDAPTMAAGFKHVNFYNNYSRITLNRDATGYSTNRAHCFGMWSANVRDVNVFNNTFIQDDTIPGGTTIEVVYGKNMVMKEDNYQLSNNIYKRISTSDPGFPIMSQVGYGSGTAIVWDGDYNVVDYTHNDFSNIASTLALHQAAEPTQEQNSLEGTVTFSSNLDGVEFQIPMIPDEGGPADGNGESGIISEDIRRATRAQPPTIGCWELE